MSKPALLVDENLSPKVAAFLRSRDFDAVAVREVGLRGKSDQVICRWAREQKRIIVTTDLDFGQLFMARVAGGAIILRGFPKRTAALLSQLSKHLIQNGVLDLLDLDKALVVVRPGVYRVRRRI